LDEDRRALLDHYRLVDAAVQVVGIGSVGTDDVGCKRPAILQFKEANASVLEAYASESTHPNHGGSAWVTGQRLM
jgi:hypothetical protein